MKRVGILYHPMIGVTHSLSKKLEKFLSANGVSAWLCSAWEEDKASAQLDNTDLILTVGGDGTILRAAQVALASKTPITGINFGKLGFMTEFSADEVPDRLSALLAGEGWIDERAMLQAEFSDGQVFHALNDVVLARGAIARLVNIAASIDSTPLTTYRADGVIVATATGSTGYSLGAGGPILHPQSKEFILTPITSHLSLNYKLVLPATSVVELHINTTNEATLSIDGHINLSQSNGAKVTVRHSSRVTRFLRIHPEAYFYGSLEQKLKGKQ